MRAFIGTFTEEYTKARGRFGAEQGIAIGPILFVVAILAVLVGAIAAGSGGFSSSTGAQTNKILGSTILEQANNLKTAVDNLTVNGVAAGSVTTGSTLTTDLFSATGGGIAPQVPPSAAVITSGAWNFINSVTINGVGSGATNYVAVLPVTQAACQSINQTMFGTTTVEGITNAPTIASGKVTAFNGAGTTTAGRMQACVSNGANYVFYQVLAIA